MKQVARMLVKSQLAHLDNTRNDLLILRDIENFPEERNVSEVAQFDNFHDVQFSIDVDLQEVADLDDCRVLTKILQQDCSGKLRCLLRLEGLNSSGHCRDHL